MFDNGLIVTFVMIWLAVIAVILVIGEAGAVKERRRRAAELLDGRGEAPSVDYGGRSGHQHADHEHTGAQ